MTAPTPVHYCPTETPGQPRWTRIAACGFACSPGLQKGHRASSAIEEVTCPDCIAASKQTEMFK